MVDITRASELTDEVSLGIDDLFAYHPWAQSQTTRSWAVRNACAAAVKQIIANVPPCPDRSSAIRKIREAAMDANQGITFEGKSSP